MNTIVLRCLLVVCVALLCGCAATHPYRDALDAQLPRQHELDHVPFFAQSDLQCGPAALATVLTHEGIDTAPDRLAASVFTASRKGSLPLDMLGGARRAGAVALELPGSLNAVFTEVASGRPVVVLQNQGLSWYPVWHYAVLVGYDTDKGTVVLRSGKTRREVLTLRTFDNTWQRSDRWAMITMQPGAISQQVDETRYSAAAVALERIGHADAAQHAYEAGVARWPDSLVLRIGAGNSAYKRQQLSVAETHYRTAALAHPQSDAALNNLAQVLADLDKLDEASEIAAKAVAIGGPQAASAKATAATIRAKQREAKR